MLPKLDELRLLVKKYETHPEFLGIEICDPNQRGAVDDTLLHLAARTGATEDVKLLIRVGADIDIAGDLGNTPLHQAAMFGQTESIEILLKLGARKDLKNEFGETPLDVAESTGREEVILLLKPIA